MVQVDHHEGGVAGGEGEPEHTAPGRRGHLRAGAVIVQIDTIIARGGRFRFVAEPGPVAGIRVLGVAGGRFHSSRAGHEEKVPEVRDARPAEVRQAEAHDRGFRVFVSGCGVVVGLVGVGADLDAAERDLRSGIDISESGRPHERVDIFHQFFRGNLRGQAGQHAGQKDG